MLSRFSDVVKVIGSNATIFERELLDVSELKLLDILNWQRTSLALAHAFARPYTGMLTTQANYSNR